MKKILIVLFGSLLFITSCETIVDDLPMDRFDLPKEKLVINSLISPQDSMIYVKVSISSPLFSDYKSTISGFWVTGSDTIFLGKSNNIANAVVTLSSDTQSVIIPYHAKNELYALPTKLFKIEAGKTYTLKASTKTLQVEASTTVPLENAKIEYLKVDSTATITYQGDTIQGYEVQFNWQDIPNKKNYYRMRGELEYFQETPVKASSNTMAYETQKRYATAYWRDQKDNFGQRGYLEDLNYENNVISSPVGRILIFYSNLYIDNKNYTAKPSKLSKKLKVQILNLSKDYYDFYNSVSKSNEADDNPFAEPVPVFTNVKNGLGCFASYNKSEIILSLK